MSQAQDRKRTPQEIEADLARTRLELTSTVDELTDRLDPRRQVQAVKADAMAKVDAVTAKAKAFTQDVKKGDPKALGIVGAGVVVTALVITLAVRRGD